jgi:hypothetical protein
MAEGIKSLATTAGYFAPGAGVLDALGMYPDENSVSMLQNLKSGEFGRAGLQGLGALGDALIFSGLGAPLGASMKILSKSGKMAQGGAKQILRGRKFRESVLKNPRFESSDIVRVGDRELPLNTKVMEYISPSQKGLQQQVDLTADVFRQYATKNRMIGGAPTPQGSQSKYFLINKDVGLGPNKTANIAVRISDHPPTLKGLGKERSGGHGGKQFQEAHSRINIAPGSNKAVNLEEAIANIEKMYLKPGSIEDIVRSGRNITPDDLRVAKIKKGEVISAKTPYHWRSGGQLPFGLDVSRL